MTSNQDDTFKPIKVENDTFVPERCNSTGGDNLLFESMMSPGLPKKPVSPQPAENNDEEKNTFEIKLDVTPCENTEEVTPQAPESSQKEEAQVEPPEILVKEDVPSSEPNQNQNLSVSTNQLEDNKNQRSYSKPDYTKVKSTINTGLRPYSSVTQKRYHKPINKSRSPNTEKSNTNK